MTVDDQPGASAPADDRLNELWGRPAGDAARGDW